MQQGGTKSVPAHRIPAAVVPEEDGRAEISPASEAADDFTAEGIE